MPLAPPSREALTTAVRTAQRSGSPDVRPVHLLEGLLEGGDHLMKLLGALDVDVHGLHTSATEAVGYSFTTASTNEPSMSRQLTRVLTAGAEQARSAGEDRVWPEHLLSGVTRAAARPAARPGPPATGPPLCPTATSTAGSFRTRRSTSWTRPPRAAGSSRSWGLA